MSFTPSKQNPDFVYSSPKAKKKEKARESGYGCPNLCGPFSSHTKLSHEKALTNLFSMRKDRLAIFFFLSELF